MMKQSSSRLVSRHQGSQLLLITFVCLFSLSFGQKVALDFCEAQNPLIRMLKKNDVKIYRDPKQSDSKTCQNEWKVHLTCCDAKSLVEYAEEDIKRVDKAIRNVQEDVVSLMKFVKKFEEEIEEAIKDSKMSQQEKKDYVEQLNKDLKKFKKLLDSLLNDHKEANNDKEDCFDRIKQIRTNSLCYSCSGRSAQFFLQGLARMKLSECKKTVNKCSKTWKKSIELFDTINLGKAIRMQLKRVIPKDKLVGFDDEHIEKLEQWIGAHHIREPVKDCSSKDRVCTDDSAKLLCETFISLRRSDFLQEVSGLVSNKQQSSVRGAPATVTAQTSAWAIGSGRMLLHDPFVDYSKPGQSVIVVRDENAPSYEGYHMSA